MKRHLRRLWHAWHGHPRDQTHWGTAVEGATCRGCGAHWTIADYEII